MKSPVPLQAPDRPKERRREQNPYHDPAQKKGHPKYPRLDAIDQRHPDSQRGERNSREEHTQRSDARGRGRTHGGALRHAMQQRPSYVGPVVVIGIVVVVALFVMGSYNSLVTLGQAVDAQWGQVQNVYQRRADLVPNLVATVKGAANFESSDVRERRKSARQRRADLARKSCKMPLTIPRISQSTPLRRISLGPRSPVCWRSWKTTRSSKRLENFQTLQAQLEGTENRIAFERRKYNDAARAFNTKRDTIPTVLIAGMFGSRFTEKPYFQSQPGAEKPPVVNFSP